MNDQRPDAGKSAPNAPSAPTREEIDAVHARLVKEAEASGYHLNPDAEFTKDLVEGLLVNERRYGYWNCPCRLASGSREKDMDIICPCDYRDPDIAQYGACYCALYVNEEIFQGRRKARTIPERRPKEKRAMSGDRAAKKVEEAQAKPRTGPAGLPPLSVPVWRCRACGYLCGRAGPPERCPICKVPKERFERFIG
jgi:ferredoxin-thioredoxin reductase catalytic subunit